MNKLFKISVPQNEYFGFYGPPNDQLGLYMENSPLQCILASNYFMHFIVYTKILSILCNKEPLI